jgi:hypothetical protein
MEVEKNLDVEEKRTWRLRHNDLLQVTLIALIGLHLPRLLQAGPIPRNPNLTLSERSTKLKLLGSSWMSIVVYMRRPWTRLRTSFRKNGLNFTSCEGLNFLEVELPGTKVVAPLENYQYQTVQRKTYESSEAGEQDGGTLVCILLWYIIFNIPSTS